MVETYIAHEKMGRGYAIEKAKRLRDEYGYRILSIQHRQVPMAGSESTPHSPNWGKTELGYAIVVDTDGYPGGVKMPLPEVIEL